MSGLLLCVQTGHDSFWYFHAADIVLLLLCRGLAAQFPPRRVQLTTVCEGLALWAGHHYN